jgi:hypothetical protein
MPTKSYLTPKSVLILTLLFALVLMALPVAAQQALGFTVTYGGRVYDGDQTTFTYIVSGTGVPPDLSHFDLEIPTCSPALVVVSYSPTSAVSFGVDPTTGINGIKWDVPLLTTDTRTYSITFEGNVIEGTVLAAVKGGPGFEAVSVPGPSCANPSINVEKFVSVDGITWQDADAAPGPDVELDGQVSFRFSVTNDGNTPLTNITLSDDVFDTSSCVLPATLEPEAFFECAIGPFDVTAGQHTNTATATGDFSEETVSDTDSANYFGGDRPSVSIEKSISADGGATWADAVEVEADADVSFRFVVTNDGKTTLTDFTLSDSAYDTESCALPGSLEPEESFTCEIGPFPALESQHTNVAVVTAEFEGMSVSDSDSASYDTGEEEVTTPIIIVIEGPVTAININIITIFNINVVVDPNDPILTIIRIGDVIRVEGELIADGSAFEFIINGSDITIVIIAINIIIIEAPVVPVQPVISGDCANPPPPWAPAHGWRRRCDPNYSGYTGQPPGRGRGR